MICGARGNWVCPEHLVAAGAAVGNAIADKALHWFAARQGGATPHGTAQREDTAAALAFFGFTEVPSKSEINRRFRELARKLHSDHGGDDRLMALATSYRDALLAQAPS